MKSGIIGIVNNKVEEYAERIVYQKFTGRDVWEAKMSCMFTGTPLSVCNKELFDTLHNCLNNKIKDINKGKYDEEDLLMHISSHKFKYFS